MLRAGRLLALAALACVQLALACTTDPCEAGRCIDLGALPPPADAGVTVTNADAACAMQSARAERGAGKPLDIVFVIDNSGSMNEEIAAVRDNINRNFAAVIEESGVDYRVVMISRFGTDNNAVCIEPPLAGSDCGGGLYETNSSVFFHYNLEIDSYNAFCQLLLALDLPDPEGRAPAGVRGWLRPEAQKAIIVITDDSAACVYADGTADITLGGEGSDPYTDALAFHSTLLAKAPELFGARGEPRYSFYAFVGMAPHEQQNEPYFPHEELVSDLCGTAPSAGLSYQALSVVTDALRYPVCEGRGFDSVFRVLARNVVESTKAECVFAIPAAPRGQSINHATISIEYRPGGGAPERIEQVKSAAQCDDHSFRVQGDQLELCPDACARVEADHEAQLQVLYGCLIVPE